MAAPFLVVGVANDVSLDFHATDEDVTPQHYAFLIDEPEFDAILGRIRDRGLDYWADPGRTRRTEINRRTAVAGSISRTRTGTCSRS